MVDPVKTCKYAINKLVEYLSIPEKEASIVYYINLVNMFKMFFNGNGWSPFLLF